ncbi:MAG: glutathione peroxidase [Acidobacteriota bacterium]|nr:glutathione peroxidase [Acidobacteriota bacterium]
MTRTILLVALAVLTPLTLAAQSKNFHDFAVKSIDGKTVPLSQYKGKKILVVNVASKCGLTPQYKQLQALYDKYGKGDFVILGFPANDFAGQEPGTDGEIAQFCSVNYGVTFPMMSKISVKGEDIAPVYRWLTRKDENGRQDADVTWNFQKFLIDENGGWAGTFEPKTPPDAPEIVSWIEQR